MMPKNQWFAVRTKQAAEYLAETEMRRAGIETYMPQYRREYQHHRSKRWIVRSFPLFQGYVFAFMPEESTGALRWLDGVDREGALKDASGKPVALPPSIIAELKDRQEVGQFDELKRQGYALAIGEKVMLKDGPFAGFPALVDAIRTVHHVEVLVNIFGRLTLATTSLAQISKAA